MDCWETLWQWDSISSAGEWIESNPGVAPSARQGHAMVYDPNSGAIVLFGGLDANGLQGDTWTWNDPFWQPKSIPGPSARLGHAMAYNTNVGAIVLFGGTDANGVENDMWTLTYTTLNGAYTWTQVTPATVPPPRTGHAMAYDPGCTQLVVYGGFDTNGNPLSDTWEYIDGNQTWSPAPNLGTTPGPLGALSAAYFPLNLSVYVYGGNGSPSSTTNFATNLVATPAVSLYGFNFNPHQYNNGVSSNYVPCSNVVTGTLWGRTLSTVKFSWYGAGGDLNCSGRNSFTWNAFIETDQANTQIPMGTYPVGGGWYDQYSASSSCNDTFAGPRYDCTGGITDDNWCHWSKVPVTLYDDYALSGDFCPGMNLNISFFSHPWRSSKDFHIGTLYADGATAAFADSVYPDACGSTGGYHVNLQYADPTDPPPLNGTVNSLLSNTQNPSKVNLQWYIAPVGVGTGIGSSSPCAGETDGPACKRGYFEYDQISGSELRFRARVTGQSLTDPATLAAEGGLRQFTFYVDADNSTNTGDQCCFDLGADYYVQVTQTLSADGSQINASTNIFQWNDCVTNGTSCGPGAWIQTSDLPYNLFIGTTEMRVTVKLSSIGDPQGYYAAWVVETTPFGTSDCSLNSLPQYPCQCKMVMSRVVETNCPYVTGVDTSLVSVSNILTAPVTVTFNKGMSVIASSSISVSPPQAVNTFLVSPANNTLHIRPASGTWAPGCYTITVLTSAEDASGNMLCSPYSFNLCVPDTTFYSSDQYGNPTNIYNEGDNIYVEGCGFIPGSTVTLYLVTPGNLMNQGSVLADWTTTGAKQITADANGCLPSPTLIGMATEEVEYKIVADTNNKGIYDINVYRFSDLCGLGLQYGMPCTNQIENSYAAYWPFDEASAAGPVNELYNANNGIVIGANTTLIPGEIGRARTFNLNPLSAQPLTYVVVSNALDFQQLLRFGNSDFSIELWLKTSEINEAPLVDKRLFNGNIFSGYYFYLSNGVPMLQMGDGNSVWTFTSGAPSVANGNWNNVSVTVNQTSFAVTIYVNGLGHTATPSLAYSAPIVTDNTADLWMAANQAHPGTAPYYIGAMDDLSMYRVALTAVQARYIYTSGTNGKCADNIVVTTNNVMQATNYLGNSTQFTFAVAETNFTLGYQWFTNGVPVLNGPFVTGANSSVLTILPTSIAQSGTISLRISNVFGYTYTTPVPFTVLPITPSTTVVGFNSAWKYLGQWVESRDKLEPNRIQRAAVCIRRSGAVWFGADECLAISVPDRHRATLIGRADRRRITAPRSRGTAAPTTLTSSPPISSRTARCFTSTARKRDGCACRPTRIISRWRARRRTQASRKQLPSRWGACCRERTCSQWRCINPAPAPHRMSLAWA